MIRWNQNPSVTYFRGINDFSDLTPAEVAAKYLMKGVRPVRPRPKAGPRTANGAFGPGDGVPLHKAMQAVPDQLDWRKNSVAFPDGVSYPVVPLVRDQKGCGSCWAHAALAALESKAIKEGTNSGPDLSEQQMIDCVGPSQGYKSAGCAGGYIEDVFDYVSRRMHALREVAYPNIYKNGTVCKTVRSTGAITLSPAPGYVIIPGNRDAIMRAVALSGPVAIYFYAEVDSFTSYTSGVYPASSCRSNAINHAMTIVGYSVSEKPPYWIARGSWGAFWGEGGYARIEMTKSIQGTCGMYLYGAMQPLATRSIGGPVNKPPSRPPAPPPLKPRPPPPPPPPISNALAWGGNWYGQLGNGTSGTNRLRPVAISGRTFTQLTAGYEHTCGLLVDGTAMCWGYNDYGQLGDGTSGTNRLSPVAISGRTFTQLTAGIFHTCGLLVDGTAMCWGNNDYGQLGDRTSSIDRLRPAAISGSTFTQLTAGYYHTCGLRVGGTAMCWGYNGSGQVGDGTYGDGNNRLSPIAISGHTFKQLAAGGEHTCGLLL